MPSRTKVTVYIREHITRKASKAKPRYPGGDPLFGYGFPADTIFCLRYTLNEKRLLETLPQGTNYGQAKAAGKLKEAELLTGQRIELAKAVTPAPKKAKIHALSEAVEAYLAELRENRRPEKSIKAKRTELREFYEFVKDKPLEEVKRADLIAFRNHLFDERYAQKTVLNKLMAVCTFLKKNPVLSITGLLKAEDWPDDPETEPNPYLHKEIKRMLVFADQREDLLVRFFHGAGMREQEVAHAELSDINFAKKFIQVQVKPKWNWKPKTKAGTRKVPLGDALLADIQKHCSDGLLFPNPSTGRPEGHFLRLLQNLAKRAGVCGPGGKAAGCHRFRDTFATDQVRARILDLRDIAKIMGHENLDMMKLYAAYVDLESQEARNAANVSALLIQRTDAEVQVQ